MADAQALADSGHFRLSDLVITAGGAVTSFGIIALNLVLAQKLDFDFLSLSFWFVVPAGALIGGMGAASGYYFAAKWTHTMPSRRLLLDMVVIGGTSWMSYQWLDYYTFKLPDGTPVRELASFWQYFTLKAEHMQLAMSFRGTAAGTTGELGALGYVRNGLQFIGFLAGGLAAYRYLEDSETCERCRKYTKNTTLLNAVPAEQFDQTLAKCGFSLPGLVDKAQEVLGDRPLSGLDLVLSRCPECGTEWVCAAVVVPSGSDYKRINFGRWRLETAQAREVEAAAKQVVAEAKVAKK